MRARGMHNGSRRANGAAANGAGPWGSRGSAPQGWGDPIGQVAILISGHNTRSILDRYNIVDERDLHEPAHRLDLYLTGKKAEDAKQQESENDTDAFRTPQRSTEKARPGNRSKLLN